MRLPREVWVLVGANFVIALGFGLVAPVLPQYARNFGVGVTAATIIVSSFAAMRLAFAPASGSLVQRLGERPVYAIGLLTVAASTGACAFATQYWQLLLFRSLGGVGSTMFTISSLALMIRIAPPAARGRVSGVSATSFLVGSIGGPLLGGSLVRFGLSAPFVVYAIALLVAAAFVHVSLRHSVLAAPAEPDVLNELSWRGALRHRRYRVALVSNFATGWAVFGVRVAVVPLFVEDRFDGGAGASALALTSFAIGTAICALPAGRWSDRWGRRPFAISGLALCGGATVAMGFMPNLVSFYVVSLIAGAGSGLVSPAQVATVADIVGGARGGPVYAAYQMCADIGSVTGPVAAGFIIRLFSYQVAFVGTGALLLVAMTLWIGVRDRTPHIEPMPVGVR